MRFLTYRHGKFAVIDMETVFVSVADLLRRRLHLTLIFCIAVADHVKTLNTDNFSLNEL